MAKPKKHSKLELKKHYLINSAWERQKLGLSLAEFNALTPFEIACELQAQNIIEQSNLSIARIVDFHLARISLMLNGYRYPELKTVDNFRILQKNERAKKAKSAKRNTLKNFAIVAKQHNLAMKLRAQRDAIRAKRRLQQNG